MNLKIVTAQNPYEVTSLVQTSISKRLFVSGWSLRKYYRAALENPSKYTISIAYVDDIPVGVTLVRLGFGLNGENHVVCFVRAKYRRQGIATKLTQSIKASCPGDMYAEYGVEQSRNFFSAIGVEVIN